MRRCARIPATPMNATRFLQNALVVLVSLLLSLLAAEGVVRLTPLGNIHVAETDNHFRFYEFDPRLGWKNAAGRHGRLTRKEFSYDVSINSHGMRYREVQRRKPPGVTRVAVLGDSFVWGIGVSDGERFTELVEERSNGKYELLNFGVSGYGPIQYSLIFDEIVTGFQPDVVLLTFCLINDFVDNVFWCRAKYYKPYVLESPGPDVVIAGYPLPRIGVFTRGLPTDWLADYSRLYTLATSSVNRAAASLQDHGQAGLIGADELQKDIYFPQHSPDAADFAERMVAINTKVLTQIRDKARAHDVPLAVVVAPTRYEYESAFPKQKKGPNMNARNHLLETLKELGIPAIDSTDAIDMSDFWKYDMHWRPSGHAKIADGILDWLNTSGLPTARP